MSQTQHELPKVADDLAPKLTHHQILPKGEDRISGKECPPIFFGLTKKSRENIMRWTVASLDQFLLKTGSSSGSTLSRLNVYVTKNEKGQKVLKIAGCTVGDSPLILADAKAFRYLTKSHNLSNEEMRKKFTKGQVEYSDTWRHYDHVNMGRSMNDPMDKQDPQFTAEPEIIDGEIVMEPGKQYKLILASDGIGEDKKCVLKLLAFNSLNAKNIANTAKRMGSTDDISVIVIDIPPAKPEDKEFKEHCATYGVDDGHGGAKTATLCSTYYHPIQHFWTLVSQASTELETSLTPEIQKDIQKHLVNALYELYSQGKIKNIMLSDLLFHPIIPSTENMRKKLNQLYTKTFGPLNQSSIENFIKSGNNTLFADAKEFKGINWDDMYDLAIASEQKEMTDHLRSKGFSTFESWATRLAEKQDEKYYRRAIKHDPKIKSHMVGEPPKFPIDIAREMKSWDCMKVLLATPADAYAYIMRQPKAVLQQLEPRIVPGNGLYHFSQSFITYLIKCDYLSEPVSSSHLDNNKMTTNVFQYLLDKIENSKETTQLKLKKYDELYGLATQFFNLDSSEDVQKYVRDYAREALLNSEAKSYELFVARGYSVFNEHRNYFFGMLRKTDSVKRIEEKLNTLDPRIMDGLSSNLTKSALMLGILGCGFEVYLHSFEGDLVDTLAKNPNLNLGLEISLSVITFLSLLYVVRKEYLAYKAKKEMTLTTNNLAEDKVPSFTQTND